MTANSTESQDGAEHPLSVMAAYYKIVLTSFTNFGEQTKWVPTDDSYYEYERRSLLRKLGPSGPWDDSDTRGTLSMVFVHLVTAAYYLGAVPQLLLSETIVPIVPIVRSVFEIAGRIAWLLDDKITVRERSARLFLARLDDASRRRTAAKSLNHPDLRELTLAYKNMRKVELFEKFYSSEVVLRPNGDYEIACQVLPGMRESTRVFDRVSRLNWNSPGMYDYMSNSAHPTMYTAMEGFKYRDNPALGEARLEANTEDIIYPGRVVRAGILAFNMCWKLFASYLGLDVDLINKISDAIDMVDEL